MSGRFITRASSLLLRGIGVLPDDAIRGAARALFSRSWRRFEHAVAHPREVQIQRLLAIVERAKGTAFGREHRFEEVHSLEDYRRNVPIRGYDEIEPYLSRMTAGEDNVLIPERPILFARSSGTTGRPKYIPVTPMYMAEFRLPRRVWARQVVQAFPGLVRGKLLTVHSPRVEGHTAGGVPYGSITIAFGASDRESAAAGSPLDAVPRSVFLIENFQLRYYTLLRLALQESITLAGAVNPSTLVLIAKKLDEFGPSLADDLERGRLTGLDALGEPIATDVRLALRRDELAARRIREAREARGRVIPTDVWPDLVGLLCWKGGSAPFYLARLEELYPGRRVMDYGYVATEGGFSIPLSPEGARGVVAVTGHFLEFVPDSAMGEGRREPVLLADELRVGERYRVLITGCHGLYRYDINDVVQCVGRYRETAEIVFVHKGGNMLSITGEKIAESHVVDAATRAETDTGLKVRGFCLVPSLSDPPHYVLGIEPERDLDPVEIERFLTVFEEGLRSVNIEYTQKRETERLGPLEARVLPRGAFERERDRCVRNGAPDSHVKPLHLARDPAVLDRLGDA